MWNKKAFTLQNFSKKNLGGFTIIELMAVIFVFSVGVSAMMFLVARIFSYDNIVSSKLVAAYLAQEGIEIVRNMRDGNWIDGAVAWDHGINEGEFEIDYNDSGLSTWVGEGRFLRIRQDFYNYDSGQPTKFKRKIIIAKNIEGNDEIQITVQVNWTGPRGDFLVEVVERLYEWR